MIASPVETIKNFILNPTLLFTGDDLCFNIYNAFQKEGISVVVHRIINLCLLYSVAALEK